MLHCHGNAMLTLLGHIWQWEQFSLLQMCMTAVTAHIYICLFRGLFLPSIELASASSSSQCVAVTKNLWLSSLNWSSACSVVQFALNSIVLEPQKCGKLRIRIVLGNGLTYIGVWVELNLTPLSQIPMILMQVWFLNVQMMVTLGLCGMTPTGSVFSIVPVAAAHLNQITQRVGSEMTCQHLFVCCIPQWRGHMSQYIASAGLSL